MNEKFKAMLNELNCVSDHKFKADDIPFDLFVVNDDNEPTDVDIINKKLNVCFLPAEKTFGHILYDVYRALSAFSTILDSYQGDAEKFLENNYPDMPAGLRLVISVNMARDAYAVEKSMYMGTIATIIPLKDVDTSRIGNSDFISKQIKDENDEIIIRRKYMKKFMEALNKEKSVSKRRKRPLSLKERNSLFDNFIALAELNGYDTSPKLEDKIKELPLEEQKKIVEGTLLPMQFVCKRLHLPYTNKDTFEMSCKRLIKVFDREEPDYDAFMFNEKKKKADRKKDIDKMYLKMRPLVQSFLKPQYEIYSKEFSMIKRGPLRDMISSLMKDSFMEKTYITNEEITMRLDMIKGIR